MERVYKHGFTITPNDSANCAPTAAIYVGATGNVNCIMAGDTANTNFVAVPAGTTLTIRVTKVWATGTTANNLVGLT